MNVHSMFETLPIAQYEMVFTKKCYPDSYENYLQSNVDLRTVLAKRKFEQADFAQSILAEIELAKAEVKSKSFFKRSRYEFYLTQAVVTYALPMLLALEDDEHMLTGAFIAAWQNVFHAQLQAASHEVIAKSFNASFMGMPNPFKENI